MAEKLKREKEKNEKLKELKARLNFEGCFGTPRYFESKTVNAKEHEKRHRSRRSRSPRPNPSMFSRIRRERSRTPRHISKEGGVFKRLGSRGKSVSVRLDSYNRHSHLRYTEALSESEDSGDPFTPWIRYFDFPKTRMPSHIKTYDGSEDPDVGNKMHKPFPLPGESSHWQYKFLLPVKVVPTARRLKMPLPGVCTAIEEM
nr:hypothetical protein [Tanacetum cinerariifolium]